MGVLLSTGSDPDIGNKHPVRGVGCRSSTASGWCNAGRPDALMFRHGLCAIPGLWPDGYGYITGSGWASYCENGTVCGIKLPEGLKESEKLPEPIYTPSTKAEIGDHDENVSFEQTVINLEKIYPGKGQEYAEKLRDYTIALYKKCAEYALSKGIIIADTKFEFGLDENGNVILGDEMLTPDSSRFWPLEGYEAGKGQPSYDKQFVRDWLKANPDSDYLLPDEVIEKTVDKYKEAYEVLTGKKFEA